MVVSSQPTVSPQIPIAEVEIELVTPPPTPKLSKGVIRSSLKASTWDGVFATIFSNVTGGVLLSDFLLQLGATPVEIGLLSSIPMVVNLLQPLGAYVSEQTTSRHWYGLWIFGPSRLLWLILSGAIAWQSWHSGSPHNLVVWTLAIVFLTNLLGALGSASWLSWMAALVPRKLRGRYFGLRNMASNSVNLICVPLLGLALSAWPGSKIEGYGVLLLVGAIAGIISLGFQFSMADINPQEETRHKSHSITATPTPDNHPLAPNSIKFLVYLSFWTFSVNTSAPFFNLYLLDNLKIDVSWVTIYGSIMSGASLLMLMVWGKLADRWGNRPLLLIVGVMVALTPLLWLGTDERQLSLWLWFPLLHLFMGGTWAAIDLCGNNLQMAVATGKHQATFFGIAAAVTGVSGALGATVGGFVAQNADFGGLPGVFSLSAVLRLLALLALVLVSEQGSHSVKKLWGSWFGQKSSVSLDAVNQGQNPSQ
ncbi:MFS transporter [Merismopedia glauca]|uniref:MFS transporter n=1 Tax=Merismopedia glauca CCAP 1448/3 TaxID=1296344 RepID=A0A2T1C514_9CYAN|nr:MFS transporter [Merismopedia glauca]PSB03372.1 MFS transporter [Merismopedia glauca CCAP 1448/3]